jgi:phage terminase large subunit
MKLREHEPSMNALLAPDISQLLASPLGFSKGVLQMPTYSWQDAIFLDADRPGAIAVKACNGAGKTTRIAAPLALWNACIYSESLTVATAGVFRQVKEQLFPAIRAYANHFPEWQFLETSITAHNGSRILGFSTDAPGNFEGFHNKHLLMIADEAKSIPDAIFQAMERCQPERTLLLSSPGSPSGTFYEAFGRHRKHFRQHTITAFDCPHISRQWIDAQIEKHGENSPFIRSMIFAEFSEGDELGAILSVARLEHCLQTPPVWQGGRTRAFCDFAAGGDENVLAIARGNRVQIAAVWRDRDTMRAVGRFIQLFREHSLPPQEIACDGGGLGIPICDRLKELGWLVRVVNNGSPAKEPNLYANVAAEIWMGGACKIERAEVILPDDRELFAQLTSRRAFPNSRGQIALESKEQMRARGLASPDRADAVLGCLYQPKVMPLLYA